MIIQQESGGVYVAWGFCDGRLSTGNGATSSDALQAWVNDANGKSEGYAMYRPDSGVIDFYPANRRQQGVQQ
ncbi:MAG: hypothetical protein QNK32_01980 [Porticoccus sp.]|nr:hypothetical protein [Porticoccus sp.]